MSLFDELDMRKREGEKLELQELGRDKLKQLFFDESVSDSRIAELFGVSPAKVAYLRRKLGITLKKLIPEDLLLCKSESALEANIARKEVVFNKNNIDTISKALTHFVFRNGPIEDMHAVPNSKLNDADMKTLCKYMVDHLALVFNMIMSNRWYEFEILIGIYSVYGRDWDKAEINEEEVLRIVNKVLTTIIDGHGS